MLSIIPVFHSGVTWVGVTRAASDDVTLPVFYLEKTDDLSLVVALWKVMTFFSCRQLTTPIFPRRLSSVLSKFSHKKINFIRVSSPLKGVMQGSPLPAPSDATGISQMQKRHLYKNCNHLITPQQHH